MREGCELMEALFRQALEAGIVERGVYNTGLPGKPGSHFGHHESPVAIGDVAGVHFGPWLLDSAATGSARWQAELANTALHEIAHAVFPDHGADKQFEIPGAGLGPQYTEPPYSYLNFAGHESNPQTCIKYP